MISIRTRVVVLAGVVGAVAALGIAATPATAQTLPLSFDLGLVLPGETQSVERTIDIPHDATVTEASFGGSTDDGQWRAELCSTRGCTDVDDLDDAVLRAGDYRLVVTLTMPASAAPVLETSASGALTLVEAGVEGSDILPGSGPDASVGDGLAATGGTLPLTAMLAGAALASGGAFLVIVAGRRRSRAAQVDA